jgi:2,3-bisphosphoglycerate-independent phosphoglycerate mutase
VAGATGFVDTNYQGKAQAAIKALESHDLVIIHVEAPDEAGHSGNAQMKKKAVELIDKHIVGPVHQAVSTYEKWRIVVIPDHPTPVRTCAHVGEPVPFAMAGTGIESVMKMPFSEANAQASGLRIEKGCEFMEYFLKS